MAEAPFVATHGDRTATVTRWMENIDAPPFWAGQIKHARGYEGKVDRWQIIRFEAPCTVNIDVGVAEAGQRRAAEAAPGDRSKGVNGYVLNTITPETDRHLPLLLGLRAQLLPGRAAPHAPAARGRGRHLPRGRAWCSRRSRCAIDEHPDHQFYNLNIDAGSMWARRLIDRHGRAGKAAGARDPDPAGPREAAHASSCQSQPGGRRAPRAPAASQARKAQLRLREMILAGELPGGARIAELAIVEQLGVSRTPIRAALMRLEQEGLLEALPNGGYAVRTFSERDVSDAIELRGTLEGLSARLAAERGAPPVVLNEARDCLRAIDARAGASRRWTTRPSRATSRSTSTSTRC